MTSKLKPTRAPKLPDPDARVVVLTLKVSENELKNITTKAMEWTGGNVSEFIRAATLDFKPTNKRKA